MYCPECGDKTYTISSNAEASCYDCPRCEVHWIYVEGTYTSVGQHQANTGLKECPVCEGATAPL